MPEVIDLLSSTPPPPVDLPPHHPGSRSQPPLPAPHPAASFLSDEFDASTSLFGQDVDVDNGNDYGDDLALNSDTLPKRPRLSRDHSSPRAVSPRPTTRPSASRNLFAFSDEDFLLPSDGPAPAPGPGPGPSPSKSPFRLEAELGPPSNQAAAAAWNGESDPIVFTSSAPDQNRQTTIVREANFRRADAITIDDDDDDDNDGGNGAKRKEKEKADKAPQRNRNVRVPGSDIEEFSSDLFAAPDLNELLAGSANPVSVSSARQDVSHKTSEFSNRTANLLASLGNRNQSKPTIDDDSDDDGIGAGKKKSTGRQAPARKKKTGDDDLESLDDLTSPRKAPRKQTSKLTSAEKEARAKEREAAKAQRESDKLLEKERKQKLKEEKAREKQVAADMAEANKLKVDKKESTPEMIIDLCSTMEGTSVGNQTTEFMARLGVQQNFFASSIPNVVKWRRKVTARFNESAGHWEPCAFHVRDEDHVLVLLSAQEFVDMVLASPENASLQPPSMENDSNTKDLEQHVRALKSTYPNCTPIYLIEGLTAWLRKNNTSRNRTFQAAVRRQMETESAPPPSQSTSSRGRKKTANKPETTPPIPDDTVEDALLSLQVIHTCLIHHTAAPGESAEWIKNFTEHVSTVPYRRERMDTNDSAFCMDVGQVKSGENKHDTFVKMLQEVNRVTASMAYGIAAQYPSVVDLVHGMRREGSGLLEDVKKSANRNGALTDSRIGPAASKRLYKVFMGLNPSQTDV